MQIFGHRGAKGYVLENTIASFQKALSIGVTGVELDIQLSSDNELMVFHDETLDRLTTLNGLVSNYSATELKKLQIPTLVEVLQLINKKCIVNIEIKNTKATEKVIETIEEFILIHNWKYNQFIVSSFYWEALQEVYFLNSKIKLGVLTKISIEKALQFAVEINAFSINPFFKLLNNNNSKKIIEAGFEIHTWTVNEPSDIILMKQLEVSAIISDFPDRI